MSLIKLNMKGMEGFAEGYISCNCKVSEMVTQPILDAPHLYFLQCDNCKEIMFSDVKRKYPVIVNMWDEFTMQKGVLGLKLSIRTGIKTKMQVMYDKRISAFNDDNKFHIDEIFKASSEPTKGRGIGTKINGGTK